MSAVIQTVTPFTEKSLLLEALDVLGVNCQDQGREIITERVDYYGVQKFVFDGKIYRFQHDSSAERELYPWRKLNFKEWKTVGKFLEAVGHEYNAAYERLCRRLAEEERRRLEEARQKLVEERRQAVIEKAKAQGYAVTETRKKGKIQLQLVRTTY